MLQEYEAAPAGAHKFVEPPVQNEPLPVIEHGSAAFTVTDLLHVLEQPLTPVTVTV